MRQATKEEEQQNRRIRFPAGMSRSDRFWRTVAGWLGLVQAWILSRLVKEPVWRSQDGRIQLIKDLHSNHLKNIGRLLARTDDQTATRIAIEAEIARRGRK